MEKGKKLKINLHTALSIEESISSLDPYKYGSKDEIAEIMLSPLHGTDYVGFAVLNCGELIEEVDGGITFWPPVFDEVYAYLRVLDSLSDVPDEVQVFPYGETHPVYMGVNRFIKNEHMPIFKKLIAGEA